MTPVRRSGPPDRKAATKLAKAPLQSNPAHVDLNYDRHIVARVDESIWAALFNGQFRLAIQCRRCGRWLVDARSKRRHYGATCAAKAGV